VGSDGLPGQELCACEVTYAGVTFQSRNRLSNLRSDLAGCDVLEDSSQSRPHGESRVRGNKNTGDSIDVTCATAVHSTICSSSGSCLISPGMVASHRGYHGRVQRLETAWNLSPLLLTLIRILPW
jgi:hypothetical protein